MQDAEALKGKSLAELREIGRSMGIKAQMRKQELLDRILELSARGDSSPAGAEAAQPEVPVPEGEENVPEKKRRLQRHFTLFPDFLDSSAEHNQLFPHNRLRF